MIILTIHLFGAFRLNANPKTSKPFASNKVRGLLAYLLSVEGAPVLRNTLASLLWDGYGEVSGHTNLRTALMNLRQILAPLDLIEATRQTIRLNTLHPALYCDLLQLQQIIAQKEAIDPQAWQSLAPQFQHEFLAGLAKIDSPPFETWRTERQTTYRQEIDQIASRQIASRPVASNHSAGLQQPSPEQSSTFSLELMRGSEQNAALPQNNAYYPPSPAAARGNLPLPLTSFIGRTDELPTLAEKLFDPVYRWLTLLGPGGIGKTRLAIALGRHMQTHFPDGVWLIEFAALPLPNADEQAAGDRFADRLATFISAALRFNSQGNQHPAQELADALQAKTALLILDNIEHLSDGVAWLLTLLQRSPNLRFLVTSRHYLPLQAQLVYSVEGLALPPAEIEANTPISQVLQTYASLRLFVERAESVKPSLQLDNQTLAAISQICRRVEGLPLGIELAAALLAQQSCDEIAQTVQTTYSALQANLLDMPPRQRSIHAVLQTSWHLLSATERQVLAHCAIFRGGFIAEAARAVAHATPTDLETLLHKSLLHQQDKPKQQTEEQTSQPTPNRYSMHELVRQFAQQQAQSLALDTDTNGNLDQNSLYTLHQRHASYYTTLIAWKTGKTDEKQFQATIQQDRENVEAAWAWASEHDQLTLLTNAYEGLSRFYLHANLHYQAEATWRSTIAQLEMGAATSLQPTRQRLIAHLLLKLSITYCELHQTTEVVTVGQRALDWGIQLGDADLEIGSYQQLSNAAWLQGDYPRQKELLEKALRLAQQHERYEAQTYCYSLLTMHGIATYDTPAALAAAQAGLHLARTHGYRFRQSTLLSNLGVVYRDLGDFAQALDYFQQSAQLRVNDESAIATGNLGALSLLLGDYVTARTYLEEFAHISHKTGMKELEAEALAMLAILFEQTGDVALAMHYCQRAVQLAETWHYRHPQRETLIILGHLHLQQGQWVEAMTAYRQANLLSQTANSATELMHGEACLAAVWLAQNEKQQALAAIETFLAQFGSLRFDALQYPQRMLLTCYHVLTACNDARATQILEQAWQVVQSQAERISDPQMRHSLVNNVPFNREIGTYYNGSAQ